MAFGRWRDARFLAAAAALAALTSAAGPAVTAAAAPAISRPASLAIAGALNGVAAVSSRSAWAVGSAGSESRPTALIARWNGTAWARVKVAGPPDSVLYGVAAPSSGSAWAVGSAGHGTLILRWNGTRWSRTPSPDQSGGAFLRGVVSLSASDAWAAGSVGGKPLILHWNGTAWRAVRGPAGSGALYGIAATSAGNIWAVGDYSSATDPALRTLILHGNGTTWKRVPSPSPDVSKGLADFLLGVTALSGRNAWAVGDISCGCGPGFSLVVRWNGRKWTRVPSPTPGGGAILSGVAAVSARDVWAVGTSGSGDGPEKTLILRWNGTKWQRVASPSPAGKFDRLAGVAVVSARAAWAVGSVSGPTGPGKTLIERWNGHRWS